MSPLDEDICIKLIGVIMRLNILTIDQSLYILELMDEKR